MTASGEVLKIELTKGHHAIIDKEDFDLIVGYSWHYSQGYAYAIDKTTKERVAMHRLIGGLSNTNYVVDHINGNGLDNRKANIRICTVAQNSKNKASHADSIVKYKGVSIYRGKYVSTIMADYKRYHIGVFNTDFEAAKAHDFEAVKRHGDYARLNFPESLEQIKRQLSNTLFN
jgi:hypothetical protein